METYGKIIQALNEGRNYMISGLTGSCRAYFLNGLASGSGERDLLCLCATEEKALDVYRDLLVFAGPERVRLYPARDFVFLKESAYSAHSNRIKVLRELAGEDRQPLIMVSTPLAMMYRVLPPAELRGRSFRLAAGQEMEREELLRRLVESHYQRVDTVTQPGEFAVRGGIIDIFTALDSEPARLEFFGSELESLRSFDPETQRSTGRLERLDIAPALELSGAAGSFDAAGSFGAASAAGGEYSGATAGPGSRRQGTAGHSACLWDYVPAALVVADEPKDILRNLEKNLARYQQFARDAEREGKSIHELQLVKARELSAWLESRPVLYHAFFPGSLDGINASGYEHIHSQEMESFYLRYDAFVARAKEWQSRGYRIELQLDNPAIKDRVKKNLKSESVRGVKYRPGVLDKGFISQTLHLAVVTETDLIGKKRVPASARGKERVIQDGGAMLDSLQAGDYVVHENYGISRYHGMQRISQDGASKEYLLLQFAGADRLYLPVDRLELIHRYAGAGDKEPRLSRLGGADWQKTRKKVSDSIHDMAQELMELYAERDHTVGITFEADSPWQTQFEQDFPYTETPDQLQAIVDTKEDMEQSRPMDRLICGDVGYGKTEVALRAAFKAVMNGKQVALLVPTTVLAEQHFETFTARFKAFPVGIEVLSRFKSTKEQKRILQDLEKGVTDIVIGTHRLLSPDVKTARLGLLIVDEEHRFGVAQKEKIKMLKRNVDVLSLSATPIPRSLHFALSGLRDMSVIETPPPERYPVTTYVLEYDDEIIRQAIAAELERGGQVFYVHNRIQDIARVKDKLQQLVPESTITVGHGRMSEDELERNLVDFVHGRYDILLCTTIIESGLDMPNVNTIIIEMADKMGLAQLYQLRGRVGRSDRLAYAYLTYQPDRVVSEEAQKRLNAIREFTELGSGLKIAMRDLEIRGAGNILGAEQHGYMHAVGFDLYVRMLEQESARMKGLPEKEESGPHMDIDMDFYIPDTYIIEPGQKMKLYRRLLLARELDDINDLEAEVLDRYGPLPDSLNNFFRVARLRVLARNKQIKGIHRSGQKVTIQVGHPLPAPIMKELEKRGFKRQDSDAISIRLADRSLDRLEQLIEAL